MYSNKNNLILNQTQNIRYHSSGTKKSKLVHTSVLNNLEQNIRLCVQKFGITDFYDKTTAVRKVSPLLGKQTGSDRYTYDIPDVSVQFQQ